MDRGQATAEVTREVLLAEVRRLLDVRRALWVAAQERLIRDAVMLRKLWEVDIALDAVWDRIRRTGPRGPD